MKKNLLIIIGIITIVVISIIVILNLKNESSKQLEITVTTNGGVPYEWKYQIKDESIVKYVKDYVVNQDEDIEGGIIEKNFVFEGLKQGETTIKLQYVSVIDESVTKEKIYNIRVDANKNISVQPIK